MPHWFQHEFSHYLYNRYSELNLEPTDHDWNKPKEEYPWPQGINGQYEGDYFTEAIKNKIKHEKPLLYIRLLTRKSAQTDLSLISQFTMNDITGDYAYYDYHNSKYSDYDRRWLRGSIFLENGKYSWKNGAGNKWELIPGISNGKLKPTGDDTHHKNNDFNLLLKRNEDGGFLPELRGFEFDKLIFEKQN